MEFVTAIIGPVIESLMVPIKKHFGYVVSSTNYVRKMGTRMKQLDDIGVDIKNHMEENKIKNLEIPNHVPGWLKQVDTIKAEVESIPTGGNGCFNVTMRYKVGKNSSKILEKIDRLIKEESETKWTNRQKPLGKVGSIKASTSTPSHSGTLNDFESRDLIFNEALNSLQPDNKTQLVALCGMGGVGKTTMMEQLKKVVEDRKTFDWVIKADIGQNIDPIAFQQAIAEYTGGALTETNKAARADRLHKRFEEMSKHGKKNILVILDDVWEMVGLKDIGLSPLPNHGVGFKFLLTSRFENVCTQMGVETNSIFRVDILKDLEARNFFYRFAGLSDDHEVNQIGEDIVRRCGGLPIAIKIIATTLKYKRKDVWKDALSRLKHHDLDHTVHEIFEMSYNNLKKDDDKAIFLLSGLFPDDFDISVEDLMRYGWGLKLFNKVYTVAEARHRMNTCIDELISANLLIESNRIGCVKMHDLLRDFVLSNFSKVKHASIVNHGNMSEWPTEDTREYHERIFLKCTDMSKFPEDFKYPNLALLKLMHGDKSLKFPEDFYERMEKLEVVAYESMHYPLLPGTLQYSTKLRTLCLRSCSLMDDFSLLGNLINLEILSFANCRIWKLPSTIGKLRMLKVLDLTGCVDLRIDDGVFRNLVHLEELYMRVSDSKAIRFTDTNCDELEMLSRKLFALEVEFFKNKAQPKNVSFKNLERFRISMGCHLEANRGNDIYSFKNKLKLVTNRNEILESKINELFEKTEKLHLQVNDMNNLEDVLMESLRPPGHSFYNLRTLDVFECVDLRYLFTVSVASGLMNLERLKVSRCPVIEVLVYSENSIAGAIKFQGLKFLSLEGLPKLVSLCKVVNVIELPQLVELNLDGLPNFTSIYPGNKSATSSMSSNISVMQPFLNKEVVIPKLEKLQIYRMKNLKEIWPCQITGSEEVNVCILRDIDVRGCDSLVNLFPSNPMPLLHHLERLHVGDCGSIEVLFDIDLGCVGEIEEGWRSSLRYINASGLGKLREVWRMKGVNNSDHLICGFQDVEHIWIQGCKSFKNVFTPTTTNFDMKALTYININGCEDWGISTSGTHGQQINVISKEEISEVDDNIPNVAFPFHLIRTFHHLQTLEIRNCNGVEVAFEMESASSRELATTRNNKQALLFPYLEDLRFLYMKSMSHVWKCNWNKLLIPQKQPPESSFRNLTKIEVYECKSIKYLFSPLMAKFLSNLKYVSIQNCISIEEVVSNRDDEDEEMATSTHIFPQLDTLELGDLGNLKRIGGGGPKGGSNEITSDVTTTTTSIHDQFKVFEIEGVNNDGGHRTNFDDGSSDTGIAVTIPRLTNMTLLELPNLKILQIDYCDLLEHIFTSSTLESLKQLKDLTIKDCKAMQVIVKEDGEHTTTSKVVVFPRLKSLPLADLPNLKGFFLGMNEFQWPLLDKVKIYGCPQMMIFTSGHSMAPKLNYIHTGLGKHSLECGLNFHLTNASHETQFHNSSICSTPDIVKFLQFPWSYSNLIKVDLPGDQEQ